MCLEHVEHWERIASRWRPAFSFHLISIDSVHLVANRICRLLGTEPLPTETVQFLDMSDPENVKSMRTIKGVTSVYADDTRKLVYLVNGEGLWIVRHNMPLMVHECSSGDALNPLPNCQ